MTPSEKKFADEWLIDCNGTRAYMAAYPRIKNSKSAGVLANKLLAKASVRQYVDEKLAELSSKKIASAEEVMEYLTAVLRGESSAEIVVVEGTGDGCSEARALQKKPDEKEKLKAAELLGKRYGLYTENVSVSGVSKVIIEDDLSE
ncbi:MAG: terminase small subunit [Clostridia bacterium]|nr:terminase small subunit [Clostridia bacterium]